MLSLKDYIFMIFKNPKRFFLHVVIRCTKIIPSDRVYLKLKWKLSDMPYALNLNNPQSFNEKIQWLKLYDRKDIYTTMVDKYAVKEYISEVIGEKHIIPTLNVWNTVEEIDWSLLPNQFVLKTTHDSGGLVICRDKEQLDINKAKVKLQSSLNTDYFSISREWPYKNVPRKIIAEKYMEQDDGTSLVDYKFYCFGGVPKFLYVSRGLENHKTANISFLTMDWEFAPFYRTDYAPFNTLPSKPRLFEEMKQIAEKLSEGHCFLRVDLYEINGIVYFSELTFSPCAGMLPFYPLEWDQKIGELIHINHTIV